MKHGIFHFLLCSLVLLAVPVRADVLVLVHGYLGSAASWEQSGINTTLEAHGWPRAGILSSRSGGVWLSPAQGQDAQNKVFSVELPSLAPIMVQADILGSSLRWINERYPDEWIILAGHSAGGVVARTVVVRHLAVNITALITIASPHSGTQRAVQALDYTQDGGPVGWVKNLFGGDRYDLLQNSYGVLRDLVPPYPGTFLNWLNAQPHADIAYTSLMRSGPIGLGDELVPIASQDMNAVPALRGRSATQVVATGHRLHPGDAQVLLGLLGSAK